MRRTALLGVAIAAAALAIAACGGGDSEGTDLTTIKSNVEQAGFMVEISSGQDLRYPTAGGTFGTADSGLVIETPEGNVTLYVIADQAARDALVKLEKGVYPAQQYSDRVYLGGSPASGGLADQAKFDEVVTAAEGG